MKKSLQGNGFFSIDSPEIKRFIPKSLFSSSAADLEIAVALYYEVRDRIFYNPFKINLDFADYSVSNVIKDGEGHCIDKAGVLIACLRKMGIPAKLGLARVKNHMGTSKLEEKLKTQVLVPHGYVEVFLNEKWVKCTPAFNKELCYKLGLAPLEWDGKNDSQLQSFDESNSEFMEYLEDYGGFSEIPQELIKSLMITEYPHMFVNGRWQD